MYLPYEECQEVITSGKNRFTSIEFIVGSKCQNACKYCYRVPHQNEGDYYIDPKKVKLYFDNAKEMGLIKTPIGIEIFGGDPLVELNPIMEILLTLKKDAKHFMIPTNAHILENLKERDLFKLYDCADGRIGFSLSVDSPFQEKNRPLSSFGKMQGINKERDWNKLIRMAQKFNLGFHPMLYFETAEEWFNTWKFYRVDNNCHVYLLEVRHGHPNDEKLIEGVYQIAKVIEYCKKHKIKNDFNCTRSSTTPRGLGCSALTCLHIAPNGKGYFCHRVLDRKYEFVDLVTKMVNLRKFIYLNSGLHYKNSHTCMSCPIRETCGSVCVGMVEEYWSNYGCIGVPIYSQCKYFLLKYGFLSKIDLQWKKNNSNINQQKLDELVFKYFGNDIYEKLCDRLSNDKDLI